MLGARVDLLTLGVMWIMLTKIAGDGRGSFSPWRGSVSTDAGFG